MSSNFNSVKRIKRKGNRKTEKDLHARTSIQIEKRLQIEEKSIDSDTKTNKSVGIRWRTGAGRIGQLTRRRG